MSDEVLKPRAATFVISHRTGEQNLGVMTTSSVVDDRVPIFLANDTNKKAAVSLEQVFMPYASRSGLASLGEVNDLPFLTCTSYSDNPPRTNWGFGDAGTPLVCADINSANLLGVCGGPLMGQVASVGNGNLSTEQIASTTAYSGNIVRSMGLRLPMVGVGGGLTVSGSFPGNGYPMTGLSRVDPTIARTDDFVAMKAGPVDLRWDDRKQAWVGSDFFSSDIVYGYLSSNIGAPIGRMQYSANNIFTIDTIVFSGSGVWEKGKTVTCINMDQNLSITGYVNILGPSGIGTVPNMDVFVAAIRLQSPSFANGLLYMPFYIGCQ